MEFPSSSAADVPCEATLPRARIPTAGQPARTVQCDIVVVGGGLSGMCAALAARECGARVVLIEKGASFCANGVAQAALDSRLQRESGAAFDRDEVVAELMLASGYRADERLIQLWADRSGECMDWLVGMAHEGGIRPSVTEKTVKFLGKTKLFPTGVFFGGNDKLVGHLERAARSQGIEIRYRTPAVELVRDAQGRVREVLARSDSDGLVRLVAERAVILCAGGFENSGDMMGELLAPQAYRWVRCWQQPISTTTGDGIRMATWIGAAMQTGPHCLMNAPGALPGGEVFDLAMLPWLHVDSAGERFVQESTPYLGEVLMSQPAGFAWVLLDDKWAEVLKNKGIVATAGDEAQRREQFDSYVRAGQVKRADDIEGLASAMGVSPPVLLETIARYNAQCAEGRDGDFSKPADWMIPLDRGPFYAVNSGPRALVTLTGLRVNPRLQVLDTAGKVIPGLYAAGNTSGGFFSGTYPRNVLGISNGRAFTFGRLAGLHAGRAA